MKRTEDWSPPLATLAVFVVAAAVLSLRVGVIGLVEPDGARYASVAQEMLRSGDFITPRFNGAVYLDKPPMLHWLTALAMAIFGQTEFAVRLFPVIAAAAGVALAYAMGRRLFGHWTGLATGFVLLTSGFWFMVSRVIRFDMLLSVAIAATIWWAWLGSEDPKANRGHYILAAIAAGFGVLVKGPVALALAGIIFVAYLLLARRLKALIQIPWLPCVGLLAIIVVPWFALCERANPGALSHFLLHENVSRVQGGFDPNHWKPWWYLLVTLLVGAVPWTLLLPSGVYDAAKSIRREDGPARRGMLLALIWLALTVGLFSLSKIKLPTYILPAMPAVALILARAITSRQQAGRWPTFATGCFLVLAGVAILTVGAKPAAKVGIPTDTVVPALALAAILTGIGAAGYSLLKRKFHGVIALGLGIIVFYHIAIVGGESMAEFPSHRALAREVARLRQPGERITSYRKVSRGTMFYLNTRIGLIGDPASEYDFPGNEGTLGDWLTPIEEAGEYLANSPPTLLIVRERFDEQFQEGCGKHATPVGKHGEYTLYRSTPGSDARAGSGANTPTTGPVGSGDPTYGGLEAARGVEGDHG